MYKKISMFLMVAICTLFISLNSVKAEEWLYQKMYLTSHHLMSYTNDRDGYGRANLHVIEDVSTASSREAGDGVTRYAYCADVDTGGYQGTYIRSLINSSNYNGNGAKMTAILSSSYPYVTLSEMKALYKEQMGNDAYNKNKIDGLTYQEAIYVTQAAVWSISNPNHAPYTFAGNMDDDDMLKLTHARIGLTCDWSVTDPNAAGYCYPSVESTKYETNSSVVKTRVESMVNWLLSLDGSEVDGTGDVSVNIVSKEMKHDNSKNENIANVSFKVSIDNLTTVSSLSDINVVVTDSNGNNIDVDYKDGVYSFSGLYPGNSTEVSFDIKVNYSSTYGKKAYLYKSGGNQDLVSVEDNKINKTADAKVTLTYEDEKTGSVEVSKVAVTGGPELPGAKLQITDINGNLIDEWISTDQIHVVKDLKEGKYILTETIAPEGYAIATSIEFEIIGDKVTSVEMVDEVTKIYISKKDFTTEAEVPGAKLQIKNNKGEVVHEWVSESKPHYIEKLPVGEYTLIETVYPEGYDESMIVDGAFVSEYSFTVENTGEIQTIDVYNRTKTITDVPKTGINDYSTILGSSIVLIGGTLVFITKKKKVA